MDWLNDSLISDPILILLKFVDNNNFLYFFGKVDDEFRKNLFDSYLIKSVKIYSNIWHIKNFSII